MPEQRAKPIPKFTSFKPKPAPAPAPTFDREHDRERERDSKSRHRPDSSHKSRHRSHRHRSRSRERSSNHNSHHDPSPRDRNTAQGVPSQPQINLKSDADSSDLYIVDRKGDTHNVTYGTIHRYNVPQYYCIGRGHVLGLPMKYKIDREYRDEAAVLIRSDIWRGDGARHKSKSILSARDTKENRLLHVRNVTSTDATDARKDFIPLSSHGSRKRRRLSGDLSLRDTSDSEAENYMYRSIQGKAKPEDNIPSDLEVTSGSDLDEEDGVAINWGRDVRQWNAELSKHAEDQPGNIDAWLELIDYQNTVVAGSENQTRQLTAAEKKSLADIKLSLYEKALKKIGANAAKDRLLLGLLEEGAALWDSRKLSQQWHAILKHNPGYINLWVKYLDFRQAEFLDFTYERCKAIFMDCMQLNASNTNNSERSMIQAYLFLRMTFFTREAGFLELASGLWQAVLEFTFFRPEGLINNIPDQALSSFGDFWDSEVARIGEAGAKGWKSGENAVLEPNISSAEAQVVPRSIFPSWLRSEAAQRRHTRLPARVSDEVEDDDPFRVVLFEDIEDVLSCCTNWTSPEILIEGFLRFCHLPPLSSLSLSKITRSWSGDSFLQNEMVELPDSKLLKQLSVLQSDAHQSQKPLNPPPIHNMIHTLDTLLSDEGWFSSLRTWKNLLSSEESTVDGEWVRRALRLLVDAVPTGENLAEYALGVEFACDAKEAKKYAKSLLKKRSSNLRLYNTYALMEYRSGNSASASHVWLTTLSMSSSMSDAQKLEYGPLWRTWVWESLEARRPYEAVQLLMSIPSYSVVLRLLADAPVENATSPAMFLKSQRFLTEAQEHSLTVQNYRTFVAWTDCLVLLLYLTHSSSLSAAIKVYKQTSGRIISSPQISEASSTWITEVLHQYQARLLHHHVTTSHTYKPAEIRDILQDSISRFPHNTMFLSLFSWNEARFRIDERVRDVLRDITRTGRLHDQGHQSVPITTHILAIFNELHRPVYSGSTLYSARAAFERAIGDPAFSTLTGHPSFSERNVHSTGRSSVSVWKLYILFELSRNNISRAKEVFYRGMRACPWSKDLLMMAFRHLRDDVVVKHSRAHAEEKADQGMDFDELRRVYNVLLDKELRVHVEIDDEVFGEAEAINDERMARAQKYQDENSNKSGPVHRGRNLPINLPEDADSEGEMEVEVDR